MSKYNRFILSSMIILFAFSNSFAQNDLIKEFSRQAVIIDSLEKEIRAERNKCDRRENEYNVHIKMLQDSLITQQSSLENLTKDRLQKISLESQFFQKTDSIILLKTALTEINKQILIQRQVADQNIINAKENGKKEIITLILQSYQNTFDNLIESSSKLSIQRDLYIIGNMAEMKTILLELEKYFQAEELLNYKFDAPAQNIAQISLSQITQKSASLDNLKDRIEKYHIFNEGLKEAIQNIIALDESETVSHLPIDKQQLKFNKILTEISSYIFNYDFNFSNYPYLSEIILEIIKRKEPNPDANISDLLAKT